MGHELKLLFFFPDVNQVAISPISIQLMLFLEFNPMFINKAHVNSQNSLSPCSANRALFSI